MSESRLASVAAAGPRVPPDVAARWGRTGGPWDVPSLEVLLRSAARRDPSLVEGSRRLSSPAVEAEVDSLAGALAGRGVRAGSPVAWQLPNVVESVLLYRACWRLGAVAVPLHPRAGGAEVDAMLDIVSPVITLDSVDEVADLIESAGPDPASSPGSAGSRAPAAPSSLVALPVLADVDPASAAVVLFTAGSTGTPKGVVHTHRALAYKARLMVHVHGLSSADAVLMPAPLSHVSGLLNGVLVPGAAAMKTVLQSRWNADEALELVERELVTFMVGPPTFFSAMMGSPSFAASAVSSLRLISSGGAGVSSAFVEEASARLGAVVKRSYGSTEAPTIATTPAESSEPARLSTTDGRPVGEAEVRIVDPVTGAAVQAGHDGEVWVRGPELFAGYLSEGEVLTPDGWFRTGDLGRLDEDGWLTITGRLKELIIRGGENISINEVEAAVGAHPLVREVAAFAVPDERFGERVGVAVVLDAAGDPSAAASFDVAACREWVESQGLARFKAPEVVRVVPELPLLPTGKVDRRALRTSG